MGSPSDRMRRAQELWSEFGPAISRTLLCYERDADLRQDLTQDVFLAVMRSVDRIDAADHPKAYVLRIAHNVATDHVARESKHAWVALDDRLEAPGADPARAAHSSDERERLLEAVRGLRLPYRQVIALALEGFEHPEIARLLGISPGTVRVRYLRAKTTLRERLADE